MHRQRRKRKHRSPSEEGYENVIARRGGAARKCVVGVTLSRGKEQNGIGGASAMAASQLVAHIEA